MHVHGEVARALQRLAAEARNRRPDEPLLAEFLERYYAELPEDDIEDRSLDEAYAAAYTHFALGRDRAEGETKVLVLSPTLARDGWTSPHSALLIVTDDAPFLVDTVRMVLDRRGIGIHLIVHPVINALRDRERRLVDLDVGPAQPEAWTMVEIDRVDEAQASGLRADIAEAVGGVQFAVADFEPMRARITAIADDVGGDDGDLLRWCAAHHFVFLGAADYDVDPDGVGLTLRPGSELGRLRSPHEIDPPPFTAATPVAVARSEAESTIHRAVRQTCIAVRRGDVEHRFVGLLALAANRVSAMEIPVVAQRARRVFDEVGGPADSHTSRSVRTVIETLPRDLLFELDGRQLTDLVIDVVGLQERPIVRAFAVPEPVGRWTTVLAYLPRDRFSAELVPEVAAAIAAGFGGEWRDVETLVGTSLLARITVSVTTAAGRHVDLEAIERAIDELSVTWDERLRVVVASALGEGPGRALCARFASALSEGYRAAVEPTAALADLQHVAALLDTEAPFLTSVGRSIDAPDDEWRVRVYRRREPATLSELLPLLDRLGLTVLDERPWDFRVAGGERVYLYDIGVRLPGGVVLDDRRRFELQATFESLLRGEVEADGLNQLVLLAGLTGRQVAILRTYARYLRQIGFAFSDSYVESTLAHQPAICAGLADLFDARFAPGGDRADVDGICSRLAVALDAVPSLDEDRILRAFLTLINATTRTNAFRPVDDDPAKGWRPVVSIKLDPWQIPDLPEPRPKFEIFVCSPRVEGVHLRGGPIARGGIRWSDRREDFRTEVLGLVKAQMVKNSVIVPVGAKGGFVLKRAPAAPELLRSEAESCYRQFVAGLLDVTDNIVDGAVTPPPFTAVYDGDDPYLVVAADKGTATFSDVANSVADHYGFWLGDAFASGGSAGYDHKAMGITARGAWESVKRHARVLGIDADRDPITVVGIGDMSGDVFGNGLLRSPHVKLVAAFDHRHIFIDPTPDPAASFAERRRLYELPRSSWADYDSALISPGGGVYPRVAKSIELSAEARAVLGTDAESLSPNQLISTILRAPVDLLWNGGIGTYVKASSETHSEVGDRANDSVRVDGRELRCRMVGEGGNLGFTQHGRVEYSLRGGLIYTDAIDNSAGVDTSDREVNIKIALDGVVAQGDLTVKQRNELLAAMTDEVAELVLDDNRSQTLALMIARRQALPMINVHARYITALADEGWLDRELEFLPSDKQIADRLAQGAALCTPELAVLMAYTKNADVVEIVASDLPDEAWFEHDLMAYFPTMLAERYPDAIRTHRLRREIVATDIANQMVNLSGISYDHRMTEDTGASVVDVARAWVAARDVFGIVEIWDEIERLGTSVSIDTQLGLFITARQMLERGSLWLLRHHGPPLDIAAVVGAFEPGIAELLESLSASLHGRMKANVRRAVTSMEHAAVPSELAHRAGNWPLMHTAFDIIELGRRFDVPVSVAADAYWALFDELELTWLWDGVGALPRSDRWQTQARSALRDDLLTLLADLAGSVLASGGSAKKWAAANQRPVGRAVQMLNEIRRADSFDLTNLSVALRQLRNLALSSIDV
jgi:glutamate dehydrogenase